MPTWRSRRSGRFGRRRCRWRAGQRRLRSAPRRRHRRRNRRAAAPTPIPLPTSSPAWPLASCCRWANGDRPRWIRHLLLSALHAQQEPSFNELGVPSPGHATTSVRLVCGRVTFPSPCPPIRFYIGVEPGNGRLGNDADRGEEGGREGAPLTWCGNRIAVRPGHTHGMGSVLLPPPADQEPPASHPSSAGPRRHGDLSPQCTVPRRGDTLPPPE